MASSRRREPKDPRRRSRHDYPRESVADRSHVRAELSHRDPHGEVYRPIEDDRYSRRDDSRDPRNYRHSTHLRREESPRTRNWSRERYERSYRGDYRSRSPVRRDDRPLPRPESPDSRYRRLRVRSPSPDRRRAYRSRSPSRDRRSLERHPHDRRSIERPLLDRHSIEPPHYTDRRRSEVDRIQGRSVHLPPRDRDRHLPPDITRGPHGESGRTSLTSRSSRQPTPREQSPIRSEASEMYPGRGGYGGGRGRPPYQPGYSPYGGQSYQTGQPGYQGSSYQGSPHGSYQGSPMHNQHPHHPLQGSPNTSQQSPMGPSFGQSHRGGYTDFGRGRGGHWSSFPDQRQPPIGPGKAPFGAPTQPSNSGHPVSQSRTSQTGVRGAQTAAHTGTSTQAANGEPPSGPAADQTGRMAAPQPGKSSSTAEKVSSSTGSQPGQIQFSIKKPTNPSVLPKKNALEQTANGTASGPVHPPTQPASHSAFGRQQSVFHAARTPASGPRNAPSRGFGAPHAQESRAAPDRPRFDSQRDRYQRDLTERDRHQRDLPEREYRRDSERDHRHREPSERDRHERDMRNDHHDAQNDCSGAKPDESAKPPSKKARKVMFNVPAEDKAGENHIQAVILAMRHTALSKKGRTLMQFQKKALTGRIIDDGQEDGDLAAESAQNAAKVQEEFYRKHPAKRPVGELPLLFAGETMDTFDVKETDVDKAYTGPDKPMARRHRTAMTYHKESGNSSVIGYGTYGKVFKAVDVYTGKAVALKRLRLDTERDGFPITAAREMQILKFLDTLKSTQVITLIEVLYEERTGVRPPDCVMVFEYMPHDLTGLMSHPSHTLTSAEKKHLSLQLISALDFIHGHNIMHRDVKAANILVNDKGLIKLADFGLARRFEPDGHPNFTNRVVTIWYRAPELLYGSPNYTVQIDFWAAACVMIEIFTGAAIFPGNGKEQNQMIKLWELLGWPTEETWPGVSQLPWYFLVRPKVPYNSCFAEKYRSKVSPELLNLFTWMFTYDPKQRPNAAQIMKHPFFTTEQPRPEQPNISGLGDWHELESKNARKGREKKKEEQRKEREAEARRERHELRKAASLKNMANEGLTKDAEAKPDKAEINVDTAAMSIDPRPELKSGIPGGSPIDTDVDQPSCGQDGVADEPDKRGEKRPASQHAEPAAKRSRN